MSSDKLYDNIFKNTQVISHIEAYILGFIYADGTVLNPNKGNYKMMRISLSTKDSDFLLRLNNYLGGNIHYYNAKFKNKYYPQIVLDINSINFVERIIKLEIKPNKTYEQDDFVFTNIPDEFRWSFICGFFDGDGCVEKINKKSIGFSICSLNECFLNTILKYIKIFVDTKSRVTKGDGVKRIRIGGNIKAVKIANLMYENIDIYLERKHDKFYNIGE